MPQDPGEDRKAVRTEDHPLQYLDFHGEIPAGQYGAGTMTIWDRGTYECLKWEETKVVVDFHGQRLQGPHALFRTASGQDWMIHRMRPADPGRESLPDHVIPMMARPARLPNDAEGWAYEIKWDGLRAIAFLEPGRLRLESRNLNDITAQYPELRGLVRAVGARELVLDGEIVAFDDAGRPSFERLQQRMHQTSDSVIRRRMKTAPVTYVIFDLLHSGGRSLLGEPYVERRRQLAALGLTGEHWQSPAHALADGERLLAAAAARGLEGLVVKRLGSTYEPGRRSGAWLKVKNTRRQELVVGGWHPGEGRRRDGLGALLVGFYDEDGTSLRYAGRVGTGFRDADLAGLLARLRPLGRDRSPFVGRQPPRGARFVEPELVAEVEFAEWTAERMLRHPVFRGLRGDKDPREAVPELEPEDPGVPSRESILAGARRLPRGAVEVELGGQTLRLSNLDAVLYRQSGFTRARLIDYYARVAPVLLPHLHDRPITLRGLADGAGGGREDDDRLANDLPGLLRIVNRAGIELRVSLGRAEQPSTPTALVFALDPRAPADLVDCCQVGLWIEGMLGELGLSTYAKTSGSTGLELHVPLNGDATYDRTRAFARAVAETLERQFPERVVSQMTPARPAGTVLVDWGRNDPGETTVCVYSLVATDQPTVSTPVAWDEVEAVIRTGRAGPLAFGPEDALARVERAGDGFASVLSERQRLPDAPPA